MRAFSRWIGVGAAVGIVVALVPIVRGSMTDVPDPLRKIVRTVAPVVAPPPVPKLDGLDLMRLDIRPQRVMAPLSEGRTAELTLDPVLQRAARSQMQRYRIPESGVVVIDVKTGKVLTYASYVANGEPMDVNARASAPAAPAACWGRRVYSAKPRELRWWRCCSAVIRSTAPDMPCSPASDLRSAAPCSACYGSLRPARAAPSTSAYRTTSACAATETANPPVPATPGYNPCVA